MSQSSNPATSVASQLKLATVWQRRQQWERAEACCRAALALDPDSAAAYQKLAELSLLQGQVRDALQHLDQAIARDPTDRYHLSRELLRQLLKMVPFHSREAPSLDLPSNPLGKINLNNQKTFDAHRSGWRVAIEALAPLHNEAGVLFDGFIENNFAWQHKVEGVRPPHVLFKMQQEGTFAALATSEEKGIIPYNEPWIGVVHNPPMMPHWFRYQDSPQTIFAKSVWQRSLEHCIGLIVLSEYMADWLREQVPVPVSTLYHPTDMEVERFQMDAFLANPEKKVVQVGWWLRRLSAIYELPIPQSNPLGYRKLRLVPHFAPKSDDYLKQLMEQEREAEGTLLQPAYETNTFEMQHLPNDAYDALLARNIPFAWLYDSSANTLVIECIARATPLLINPLPAIVEYLGPDYPFYFTTLDEAAEKALDLDLIEATHRYLLTFPLRARLEPTYFMESFRTSEVYQCIG